MRYLWNRKGSLTPSFVLIVMLMLMTGSYFFCLAKVYENRLVVRNAVDAAVTSALAAAAEKREKDTYYYEELVCVQSHRETDTDTGETYQICDKWGWAPRGGRAQAYVFLNGSLAETTAKKFLEVNVKSNSKDIRIVETRIEYTYDNQRYLMVESVRHNTGSPDSWWKNEFDDPSPPPLVPISTRTVRFPRWVKVKMRVTAEIRIPLGVIVGTDKIRFTWTGDAVKELKHVPD